MQNKKPVIALSVLLVLLLVGYFFSPSFKSKAQPQTRSVAAAPIVVASAENASNANDTVYKRKHRRHKHPKIASDAKKYPVLAKAKKRRGPKHVELVPLDTPGSRTSDDSFQAGATQIKLNAVSPNAFPPLSFSSRLSYVNSALNVHVDAVVLPGQLTEQLTAVTRVGLGLIQQNGGSSLALELGELVYLKLNPESTLTPYAGVEVSLPVAPNSKAGFSGFLGLEQKTSLFNFSQEAFFIEAGVTSYSVNGPSQSGFNVSAGYKVSF